MAIVQDRKASNLVRDWYDRLVGALQAEIRADLRAGPPVGDAVRVIADRLAVAALIIDHGGGPALVAATVSALEGEAEPSPDGPSDRAARAALAFACVLASTEPADRTLLRQRASALDPDARLVAGALLLRRASNLFAEFRRDEEMIWARYPRGREGTISTFRLLADALTGAGRTPLTKALVKQVAEIETLASWLRPFS